ncbi:MAG: natural product biosynthesis luciferase-like monooxygenase protein [Planctomycetota bacterium]|jgi:natural product biosynthesis luciferase-like monooxygenase protein
MASKPSFSCYLIGADSLLIECGETLVTQEVDIRGVITATDRLARWAERRGIPVLDPSSDYAAELAKEPFDALFSITHLSIIPDDVLALPRQWAINFHDGPLPRYAGLNTPVWALIEGEPRYGISWHMMATGADKGDLLVQKHFDVAPDETSLSINTRCFEVALEGFNELVPRLLAGTVNRTAQDFSQRTVFKRYDRPDAACTLDWRRPAVALDRLVRALDFGTYPNPIGLAKVFVGDHVFGVTKLEAHPEQDCGGATPGTVLACDGDGVQVATGMGVLALSGFCTLAGISVPPAEFRSRTGLSVGSCLGLLSEEQATSLTTLNATLCRAETFWTNRLSGLSPFELPYADSTQPTSAEIGMAPLAIPASFQSQFSEDTNRALLSALWIYFGRIGNKEEFDLAWTSNQRNAACSGFASWTNPQSLMRCTPQLDAPFSDTIEQTSKELTQLDKRVGWLRDMCGRRPELRDMPELKADCLLPIVVCSQAVPDEVGHQAGATLTIALTESANSIQFFYDRAQVSNEAAQALVSQFTQLLQSIGDAPETPVGQHDIMTPEQREQVLFGWNNTQKDYQRDACIHHLFEAQADAHPEAPCVAFEGTQWTYAEIDERANKLAARLREMGSGSDCLVGIHLNRSHELLIAILAVQKSGAAYLPLDPAFPPERVAYMLLDAKSPILITDEDLADKLPKHGAQLVCIDRDRAAIAEQSGARVRTEQSASDLAYVIYTSGSTGNPKGVMVEHRNAVNFFAGMDDRIEHETPGVWMAVTSLSFDISVLELLWTVTRGFKVVVFHDSVKDTSADKSSKAIDFGFFMWGNDDGQGPEKYRLMLEAARFGDTHGFSSIWTPERHFHAFGGPFPNPAVTSAAIAAITENIHVRSGSCVLPLHHSLRVAEEWAVVDNLSNGRVGMAFASGWQPDDFVLRPENYPNNKARMFEMIEEVTKLWRGESVTFENPLGDIVKPISQPRPVQPELPIWITTAGNPDTYRQAGEIGANILTHLLGQSIDDVADKLRIYREARAASGFDPASGSVTLMLHTFIGEDEDAVRDLVRQPMKDYLLSATNLVKHYAWSFPAFRKPNGADIQPGDIDLGSLTEEETDAMMDHAFERYYQTSGLFGTPESCMEIIEKLKDVGVDEIGCLVDYGLPTQDVLDMLPTLDRLRKLANESSQSAGAPSEDWSIAAQIEAHDVTHFQCTPSMARMMCAEPAARSALASIPNVMIGGEAFPLDLAKDLRDVLQPSASLTNMYGPTETTIWSSTQSLESAPTGSISIGKPIANTQLYVLDSRGKPQPPGVPGELFIAGDGVVRGYHEREELTAERFLPDPFRRERGEPDARMYRTGDLAFWQADGSMGFLGRTDHQVKIRGYRIELGEIESLLSEQAEIKQSVVIAREDQPGDQRLVAYLVPRGTTAPSAAVLKDRLRSRLPEYMIPAHIVVLEALPLTPNGKIDRNAFPSPEEVIDTSSAEYVAPENEFGTVLATLWQEVLGREQVGIDDNFFDIGGHSLLVVQLHRQLAEMIEKPISLTDLYRFPTIRSLTEFLGASGPAESVQKSSDRGARRRELRKRRKAQ